MKVRIICATILLLCTGCRLKENDTSAKEKPVKNDFEQVLDALDTTDLQAEKQIYENASSDSKADMSTWAHGEQIYWYEDGWTQAEARVECELEGLKFRKHSCVAYKPDGNNEIGIKLLWEDWQDKK